MLRALQLRAHPKAVRHPQLQLLSARSSHAPPCRLAVAHGMCGMQRQVLAGLTPGHHTAERGSGWRGLTSRSPESRSTGLPAAACLRAGQPSGWAQETGVCQSAPSWLGVAMWQHTLVRHTLQPRLAAVCNHYQSGWHRPYSAVTALATCSPWALTCDDGVEQTATRSGEHEQEAAPNHQASSQEVHRIVLVRESEEPCWQSVNTAEV